MQKLIPLLLFLTLSLPFLSMAATPDTSSSPSGDTTVDASWAQVVKLRGQLMTAMHEKDPSAKSLVPQMQDVLRAFAVKYPKDDRAWIAKMMLGQLDLLAGNMGLPGALPRDKAMQELEAIVADPAAPKDIRAQSSLEIITQSFPSEIGEQVDFDALDAKIAAFQKDFGDFSLNGRQPAFFVLREQELEILKLTGHHDRYLAVLNTMAADPNPALADFAKGELAQVKEIDELKTKPFELKYTAVDGTKVDLAQMRGKVVLIDFWATWCPPCVAEMPTVLKVYQKYHSQGFEIVGVSLDQDKSSLLAFTKKNGMTWPQYFDGGGFEDNAISKSFYIDVIPTMWLIDKKGMLVSTEVRDDLAAQVEKLLKAP